MPGRSTKKSPAVLILSALVLILAVVLAAVLAGGNAPARMESDGTEETVASGEVSIRGMYGYV